MFDIFFKKILTDGLKSIVEIDKIDEIELNHITLGHDISEDTLDDIIGELSEILN